MSNTQRNLEIANNIRQQLGPITLAMLGAHQLLAVDNGFQFGVKGSRKANKVRITLDVRQDSYRVEVMKIRMTVDDIVVTHTIDCSGMGAEDLHGLIEEGTGLRARM